MYLFCLYGLRAQAWVWHRLEVTKFLPLAVSNPSTSSINPAPKMVLPNANPLSPWQLQLPLNPSPTQQIPPTKAYWLVIIIRPLILGTLTSTSFSVPVPSMLQPRWHPFSFSNIPYAFLPWALAHVYLSLPGLFFSTTPFFLTSCLNS